MNKYVGITIGPIIKTLSMARKPRELWAASYLFSYLMERLRAELPKELIRISPVENNTGIKAVGLYPDRLFCKCPSEFELNFKDTFNKLKSNFAEGLGINAKYFNVYALMIEGTSDSSAIKELNEKLDFLELYQTAIPESTEKKVRNLIFKKKDSPLFDKAFDDPSFPINTLAQIASVQLADVDKFWYKLSELEDEIKREDALIKKLKEHFGSKFKTPHKYICIVHADGDNMGSIVTNPSNDIAELSNKLLSFGSKAYEIIKQHKGLPIYTGGDDLLFIAPVITGEETTIFDLIRKIDELYVKEGLPEYKGKKDGKETTTSMSYGISITYYKYPLYEALKMSRSLLFDTAKNIDKKNAIAWSLQKNSGSTVSGKFSKSNVGLYEKFQGLIKSINNAIDNNLVSAVAHKIKTNEALLGLFMKETINSDRLDAFFEKTLEYGSKNKNEKVYLDATKELLKEVHLFTKDIKSTSKIIYGMLRTAKFIKGLEEDKDE